MNTATTTYTTTSAVAAQFLMIGDVVEYKGVLLEIVSDRCLELDHVAYVVRHVETAEGGQIRLPYDVRLPLYTRD